MNQPSLKSSTYRDSSSMNPTKSSVAPSRIGKSKVSAARAVAVPGYDSSKEMPPAKGGSSVKALGGLNHDIADEKEISFQQLVLGHSQYASETGLPQMLKNPSQKNARNSSQLPQNSRQVYGMSFQSQNASSQKKPASSNYVQDVQGSSLPRIPTRENLEDESQPPANRMSQITRSKLKRKQRMTFERAPPIHQAALSNRGGQPPARDTAELLYLDDGQTMNKGGKSGLSSNRRMLLLKDQWDYNSMITSSQPNNRRLADSQKLDGTEKSRLGSKELLDGTSAMQRRKYGAEHPAYSTDLEALENNQLVGQPRVRNLQPIHAKQSFETDDEMVEQMMHGKAEISLFDENEEAQYNQQFVRIQDNVPLHQRRTLDRRDDRSQYVYYTNLSRPTREAIDAIERVYAPRSLVHPQGNQNIIMKSPSKLNKVPSGLGHYKHSNDISYYTQQPTDHQSNSRERDGKKVLAASPSPLGQRVYLKKVSPRGKDITIMPKPVRVQNKFVVLDNRQSIGVGQSRPRRNIQDFLVDYENSTKSQVNLKKQIVKHSLMQAKNYVAGNKPGKSMQASHGVSMKHERAHRLSNTHQIDIQNQQLAQYTTVKPKGSRMITMDSRVDDGHRRISHENPIDPIADEQAHGSMSNTSIQDIDPTPGNSNNLQYEKQKKLAGFENVFSENGSEAQQQAVEEQPREQKKTGRTESQYSEGNLKLHQLNKVYGKQGALSPFGARKIVESVHNNGDHVGSFDIDIRQQPEKRFGQVGQMPNEPQNPQLMLTPDQPARDMTSNLRDNVKRLSQTPNDYSKNLKVKKQRPLLPQIRQQEASPFVKGHLNQTEQVSPERSINIESGSVQFIKESQRSNNPNDQVLYALKNVSTNQRDVRTLIKKKNEQTVSTQKLLNQFQAAQVQKHVDRMQVNQRLSRQQIALAPSPVDRVYFREEPLHAAKQDSQRNISAPRHQKHASFSLSPQKQRVRFHHQDEADARYENNSSGQYLLPRIKRKRRKPTNLFDKYQNTLGKDMLTVRNRHSCSQCVLNAQESGQYGRPRRHRHSPQLVGRGSNQGRHMPRQQRTGAKPKYFPSIDSSQDQSSKRQNYSEGGVNQHYLPTSNELNNLASQMRKLEVMQNPPGHQKIRSSTLSPRRSTRRKKAPLQEVWQVVQYNRYDWEDEANFNPYQQNEGKRSRKFADSPGNESGANHDRPRPDATFGDGRKQNWQQGRQPRSRQPHSRNSVTQNSQATVKIKGKIPVSPPSQKQRSSTKRSMPKIQTPGQKRIQEAQERNSQRSMERSQNRDSQTNEQFVTPENSSKKEPGTGKNTTLGSNRKAARTMSPRQAASLNQNGGQDDQIQEMPGATFREQPNTTHVSKNSRQKNQASMEQPSTSNKQSSNKGNLGITKSKFQNKRSSHEVASKVMSIQVLRPNMQYKSFYMKNRSQVSKHSSKKSISSRKRSSRAQLTDQNKLPLSEQGGILKQNASTPSGIGGKKQLRSPSNMSKKEDVVERLTKAKEDVARSICSSSHNPTSLRDKAVRFKEDKGTQKSKKSSKSSAPSKKRRSSPITKPEMVDRAASPIQSENSIEEVNVEEVAREVREAANDPIAPPVEKVEMETQTSLNDIKQKKGKEKKERKTLEELAAERDWADSGIYQLIVRISQLPKENRVQKTRDLEKQFFNPMQLEILTEDEAQYNATLLKQRSQSKRGNQHEPETNHENEFRSDLYIRAFNTVELLSDHIFIAQAATFDEDLRLYLREQDKEGQLQSGSIGHSESILGSARGEESRAVKWQEVFNRRRSLVIKGNNYKEIDLSTVIKLLLRCVKLYQAYNDLKKILSMVRQQELLFNGDDNDDEDKPSPIDKIIEELEAQETEEKVLSKEDEITLASTIRLLRKLSRSISQFLRDHRIFKQFTFRTSEYQSDIDSQAEALTSFLGTPTLLQHRKKSRVRGNDSERSLSLTPNSPNMQNQVNIIQAEQDQIAQNQVMRNSKMKFNDDQRQSPMIKPRRQSLKKTVQFDEKKNEEIKLRSSGADLQDHLKEMRGSLERLELKQQDVRNAKDQKANTQEVNIMELSGQIDKIQDSILSSKNNSGFDKTNPQMISEAHYETIDDINKSIVATDKSKQQVSKDQAANDDSGPNIMITDKYEDSQGVNYIPKEAPFASKDQSQSAMQKIETRSSMSQAVKGQESSDLRRQRIQSNAQGAKERSQTELQMKYKLAQSITDSSVGSQDPSQIQQFQQNIKVEDSQFIPEAQSSGLQYKLPSKLDVEELNAKSVEQALSDEGSQDTVIKQPNIRDTTIKEKVRGKKDVELKKLVF